MRMFRGRQNCIATGVSLLAVAVFAASGSADAASWPQVELALGQIMTVTGESALERLRSCGIMINQRRSTLEQEGRERLLYVPVTLPPNPGDDFVLISFDWRLRDGAATPASSWAAKLQYKAAPLGTASWLHC